MHALSGREHRSSVHLPKPRNYISKEWALSHPPTMTAVQETKSLSILLVDDERSITDTLSQILRRAGYECRTAYGAADALEILNDFTPRLIITDVMMPEMDGIELAKIIRRKHPQCNILLFSGNAATQDLLVNARAEGHSFNVLAKPVHPRDFLAKVAALLS
jgi:DNA-binding response OmpR family regulator